MWKEFSSSPFKVGFKYYTYREYDLLTILFSTEGEPTGGHSSPIFTITILKKGTVVVLSGK